METWILHVQDAIHHAATLWKPGDAIITGSLEPYTDLKVKSRIEANLMPSPRR